MTQPCRWLANILVVASIAILSDDATGRRSDASESNIDAASSRLTSLPQVLPQVIKVELEARAFAPDKVKLAIHLPPGYDPKKDGPRPLLMWAYPAEFKSAGDAMPSRIARSNVPPAFSALSSSPKPIGDPGTLK